MPLLSISRMILVLRKVSFIVEHKLLFITFFFTHNENLADHSPRLCIDFHVAISLRFGGDCTASALDNRFRRLKSDAKLINAAVAKGEDPILMNVGDTNGEIACKGKGGDESMFFLVFQIQYLKSTDLSLLPTLMLY